MRRAGSSRRRRRSASCWRACAARRASPSFAAARASQGVAVVGVIADQILRLGLDHVEVEAQLDQRDLVMVRRMRAHRQRQPMAIHDRHDLHALPRLVGPISRRRPWQANVASMKPRASSIVTLLAKLIGQILQYLAQYFLLAPLLESADVPSCSSDSSAAACATARRCSKSTAPHRELRVGTGLRPGRPSGMCSSGKWFRMAPSMSFTMRLRSRVLPSSPIMPGFRGRRAVADEHHDFSFLLSGSEMHKYDKSHNSVMPQ